MMHEDAASFSGPVTLALTAAYVAPATNHLVTPACTLTCALFQPDCLRASC